MNAQRGGRDLELASPRSSSRTLCTKTARAAKNPDSEARGSSATWRESADPQRIGPGWSAAHCPPSFHIFKASITSSPGLSLELQIRVVQLPPGWAIHMISMFKPAPPANFLITVNGPVSQPVTPIRKRKSCLVPPLLHPPPLSSYQHWCFDLLNPHINLIFSHLYCGQFSSDSHHPA